MTTETGPAFPVESLLVEDDGGLNVKYNPGVVRMGTDCISIAGGSIALGDDTTTYIFIEHITHVVASNTSGWPMDCIPLAGVVTAAGDITSIDDKRTFLSIEHDRVLRSGDTMTGDLTLSDLKKLYLDTAKTKSIHWNGTAFEFNDGVKAFLKASDTLFDFTGASTNIELRVLSGQALMFGHLGTTYLTLSSSAVTVSGLLQVNSTTAGFLPPRMTTAQRDAIASPATGLMVYNTTTDQWEGWNGAAWVILG